jgi:hypothetical protein
MIRLPDWEERLHAFLEVTEGAVFDYDHHLDPTHLDCCMFSAGAVIAQTGVDLVSEFRGRYRTAAGSLRALRRYGAGTLEATLDAKLPTRPLAFARRGDLAMVNGMVGVSIGAEAVFVGEVEGAAGRVRHPRATWSKCWSVG